MKVLITGAAGFIGSQLAHRFWKDGAELILIDNFSYGHEDNLVFDDHDFRNEIIRMDIRDKGGIKSLLEKGVAWVSVRFPGQSIIIRILIRKPKK